MTPAKPPPARAYVAESRPSSEHTPRRVNTRGDGADDQATGVYLKVNDERACPVDGCPHRHDFLAAAQASSNQEDVFIAEISLTHSTRSAWPLGC